MSFEVDVVENFCCFLGGGLQFWGDFVDAQEITLVAEELKLVLEVADLIVVEARERLKLTRSEYFVAHLNDLIIKWNWLTLTYNGSFDQY